MPSFRVLDSGLPTYIAAQVAAAPGAGANDIIQIAGANLKIIKIRTILIGGTAAAARQQTVGVVRRSSADTGGTPVNLVPRAADSTDAAASAVATFFSAAPTIGTGVGILDANSFALVVSGGLQDRAIFNYEQLTAKAPTLNNSSDFICINLTGVATIATDKIDFSIWWTEQ